MNVLIILGHPRRDSFCGALARAYENGAVEAGVDVQTLVLTELEFEPNVYTECPSDQHMEEDSTKAQQRIRWADHLVFYNEERPHMSLDWDNLETPAGAFDRLLSSPAEDVEDPLETEVSTDE